MHYLKHIFFKLSLGEMIVKKLSLLWLLLVLSFSVFASWGPAVSGQFLKRGLFQTGYEKSTGHTLYLCRARYQNSWQIGKTWLAYFHCNISMAGREIVTSHYQVFYGQPHGRWQHFSGYVPGNAMPLGRDTNGNTLFLCHGYYKGNLEPGKTWSGYNHCNIPYAGREVLLSDYAIFISDQRHHRHHYFPGRHHQHAKRECVSNAFGNHACGYHCVQTLAGMQCASSPDQECVADAFGHIACGYNCAKSAGQVRCADHRYQNCVSNSFGNVQCGKNCRVNQAGSIICD